MTNDETFLELRPALFGVAYRMLGSQTESDDILQEAYLRWSRADRSGIESPRAYLTTVVTRLSIDHLRKAKARRETYHGPWLPEPIVAAEDSPGSLSDSLSLAFLVLLEELAPTERAAFLLHDVFGYGYADVAETLERNETACRQLVSRARHRIGERRHRFDADEARSQELMGKFVTACGTGDVSELMSLLAEDVVLWSDGGGQAKSAPRPVVGPWRTARWLVHVAKTFSPDVRLSEAKLNGQPGLLFSENGVVTSAVVLDILDAKILGIRIVANPAKLAGIQRVMTTDDP
jgi:RNA polymerase sigma-70 factor, ECF subfamily